MPIRFRCVYCEKLLGISRRKAGAVVSCPHCHEKLIVPSPGPEDEPAASETRGGDEPAVEPAPSAGPQLFERTDFESLLHPEPFRTEDEPVAPAPRRGAATAAEPVPLEPLTLQRAEDRLAGGPDVPGVVLSPARLTWLAVGAVLLLAVVFGAGILVGRFFRP